MDENGIHITEAEFTCEGPILDEELPKHCIRIPPNIIAFRPPGKVEYAVLRDIAKAIQSRLAARLLVDDQTYQFKLNFFMAPDEQEIPHKLFPSEPYTLGTRHFDAKPIQMKSGHIFSFEAQSKDIAGFSADVSHWLEDNDLFFLIDTYNLGLTKRTEELFYLYAVYECVKAKGGEKDDWIIHSLGMSKQDITLINKNCNDKAIRNSRHSGLAAGKGGHLPTKDIRQLRMLIKELILRYAYYKQP
jgi:hypothetical protein